MIQMKYQILFGFLKHGQNLTMLSAGIEWRHLKGRLSAYLVLFHDFKLSADFFFKFTFKKKILPGTLSECQTDWNQIRTDTLSVLIWLQTVCKGYQVTTKVPASRQRVKYANSSLTLSCISWMRETLTLHAENKDTDPPAHPHSLISAFVVHYL